MNSQFLLLGSKYVLSRAHSRMSKADGNKTNYPCAAVLKLLPPDGKYGA